MYFYIFTLPITIEETRDFALVRSIFTDPKIYERAAEDGAISREDFQPCQLLGIHYVVIKLGGTPAGVWMLVPHSAVCFEIHTAILPWFRGRPALTAVALLKEWLWSSTACLRLITNVPAYNREAAMFSRMAGMTLFGNNERSFLKDGKLHDQLMFGLSKPGENA